MNFLRLTSLIVLISCSSHKTPSIPDSPDTPNVPETNKGVVVEKITGFPQEIEGNLKLAIVKAEEVKRSLCFRDFMAGRGLIQTNNLSADQVVYELINKTAIVELEYYYKYWSKVSGYTYPDTNKIWLNGKYYSGMSVCDMASNIAHETSHKQGFAHDYKATKTRPYSVPYSINAAFKECCKN